MNRYTKLYEFAQRGYLYHFTDIDIVYEILKTNKLKANPTYGDNISLTRKYDFDWGQSRITLDASKISENYKIEPYAYGGSKGEAEERIKVKELKNIKKYIVQIDLFHPDDMEFSYHKEEMRYKDFFFKIRKDYKSILNVTDGWWKILR